MTPVIWLFIVIGVIVIGGIVSPIQKDVSKKNVSQPPDYFRLALFNFSTKLIMADSEKPLEDKLNFVESYLLPLVGHKETQKLISEIRTIVINKSNLDLCTFFSSYAVYDEKMIMLDYLITLASCCGKITEAEMKTLRSIAIHGIGIELDFDFDVFESEYYYPHDDVGDNNSSSSNKCKSEHNIENDYKMLGIDNNSTDEEVKKAYYNQVAKHHPDKVSHLGEHLQKFANEYCAKLNEAYGRIKKEREIN